MDGLSEVLKSFKLDGALFFTGDFTAPWSIQCSDSRDLAPYVSRDGGDVIAFHLLIEGRARVRLANGTAHGLGAGDIVVCPHGDAHVFSNGYPERPVEAIKVFAAGLARTTKLIRFGGGGETTRFVCGFIGCEPRLSGVLLAGLPPIMVIRQVNNAATAWLSDSIKHLVNSDQTSDPSSEMIRTRLAEVLFLDAVRRYAQELPQEATGWLAGTRDPFVGRALALIHRTPHVSWTLESLGDQVGISRSRLVERFQTYLGRSPMAYLTSWRLTLASELLSTGGLQVAEVAQQVGYSSDAGFSRAFKRQYGLPPAQYRKESEVALS